MSIVAELVALRRGPGGGAPARRRGSRACVRLHRAGRDDRAADGRADSIAPGRARAARSGDCWPIRGAPWLTPRRTSGGDADLRRAHRRRGAGRAGGGVRADARAGDEHAGRRRESARSRRAVAELRAHAHAAHAQAPDRPRPRHPQPHARAPGTRRSTATRQLGGALGLIPKETWAAYLAGTGGRWRSRCARETRVGRPALERAPNAPGRSRAVGVAQASDDACYARRVVLATGIDGSGNGTSRR